MAGGSLQPVAFLWPCQAAYFLLGLVFSLSL